MLVFFVSVRVHGSS